MGTTPLRKTWVLFETRLQWLPQKVPINDVAYELWCATADVAFVLLPSTELDHGNPRCTQEVCCAREMVVYGWQQIGPVHAWRRVYTPRCARLSSERRHHLKDNLWSPHTVTCLMLPLLLVCRDPATAQLNSLCDLFHSNAQHMPCFDSTRHMKRLAFSVDFLKLSFIYLC